MEKIIRRRILAALVAAATLAFGVALFAAGIVAKDLTPSSGLTALDVAQTLVGPGVAISNVTFRGDLRAVGTFTDDGGAIGFGGGVVLSTGRLLLPPTGSTEIAGPNPVTAKSFNLGSGVVPPTQNGCLNRSTGAHNLGLAGDDDLNGLSTSTTCDATVLELDFVPDKNRIFLQYVFGSEEYNEFVNNKINNAFFNDVFAFFVNGVNCATVDAAHQVPVSIQTINGGGPQFGTAPKSNEALFVNNDVHTGTPPRNTSMDGLTVVLTCQASVIANATNHLKLAIADASDPNVDSNVFLRAGSLTTVPPLTIVTKTNGTDNDSEPGPYILTGPHVVSPVAWTYAVKNNTATETFTNLVVTDSKGVPVSCPTTTLSPGAAMTCTANGIALEGQYENIGTVIGTSTILGQVTDSNPDHYFGARPGIAIVTTTNFTDNDAAPGPAIRVGTPVEWRYEVSNTGNVLLHDLIVTDSLGVAVSCALFPGGPPKTTLEVGITLTCKATGLAIAEQYENIGSATGTPPGGLANVTHSNVDHYFGANPVMTLLKTTNGTSAPLILAGDDVVWSYTVTNTGNVALTGVAITDDKVTLGPECTIGVLAVGAIGSCTATGVAQRDRHTNIGTSSGSYGPVITDGTSLTTTVTVTALDDDEYFGAAPEVKIVKKTGTTEANATDHTGVPSPVILVDDPVVWTYTVTNTGNVALTEVAVTDDKVVVGPDCTMGLLAAGASRTCFVTGLAQRDQHTNIGTVTGKVNVVAVTGPKTVPVTHSDDDSYFGAAPEIALVKKTGTTEANATDNNGVPPPVILVGDPVVWTYTATNTGNVALTEVAVTDDKITLGPDCTIGPLAAGESRVCVATGTAQRDQHTNVGTVTSKADVLTVTGPRTLIKTDVDEDAYFGAAPEIALVKKTGTTEANATDNNGAPPPVILVGDPVVWTYTVTNTGNVALTEVAVTDDKITLGPDCTIGPLAAGASRVCIATGIAQRDQHTNVGSVSSKADVLTVTGPRTLIKTDHDEDAYFGAAPEIALVKKTGTTEANATDSNGAPPPVILVGDPVVWTYTVTNTGNVALTEVVVTDDKITLGPACTIGPLAAGAIRICTATGVAQRDQHTNTGTVTSKADVLTVTGPRSLIKTARDEDAYFGAAPEIAIVKKTGTTAANATDNDVAPGVLILMDDNWDFDPYANSQFDDGDFPPGKPVVTFTYRVANTGNVPLTDVTVVDDKLGPVCSIGPLAVGANALCTKKVDAQYGQYENTGTASGKAVVLTMIGLRTVTPTASNIDHYFGADPAIRIVKKTNGTDSNHKTDDRDGRRGLSGGHSDNAYDKYAIVRKLVGRNGGDQEPHGDGQGPSGPVVAVGSTVTWTYEVTNIGNTTLTNVRVTDNDPSLVVTCPRTTLPPEPDPNATMICSATGLAVEGRYENTGLARATVLGPMVDKGRLVDWIEVTDEDVDFYFGESVARSNGNKDSDDDHRGYGDKTVLAPDRLTDDARGKGDSRSKGDDRGKTDNRGKADDRGKSKR